MIVLAIETSCDETSCSIINNNQVLSNIVYSQSIHTKYGGVVPNLASKDHEKNILEVVNCCIENAKIKLKNLDVIAATYGSGLLGSLIIGLNFAKGLSIGLNVPFIAISHLEGHLFSSFINKKPKYPFLSLIVSGGHTQVWLVKHFNKYLVLSDTVDDAAGEAFDKGAKILGLKYPGGPEIEKLSSDGDPNKFKFTIPEVKSNKYYFSFSGLKTALLYMKKELDENNIQYEMKDLAASYQNAIVMTLLNKLDRILCDYEIYSISIVGGVSANQYFRLQSNKLKNKYNLNINFPQLEYCTDNAAMIATAAYYSLKNNITSNINIEPNPNIKYN